MIIRKTQKSVNTCGADSGICALQLATIVLSCLLSITTNAATMKWSSAPLTIKVKDAPLSTVIELVMNHNGMPVVVSDSVKGSLSLSVTRPTKSLFEELINLYNLDWSYDGGVVSVIPARERVTKLFDTNGMSVDEINRALTDLQIADPRIPLREIQGTGVVSLSSTPRYASVVEEAIKMITARTKKIETDARAETDARTKQKPVAELAEINVPRGPAEEGRIMRVFKLSHATATDVTLDSGNSAGIRVQGVASMLREAMEIVSGRSFRYLPNTAEGSRNAESNGILKFATRLSSALDPSSARAMPVRFDSDSTERTQVASIAPIGNIISDARTNSIFIYDAPSRMSAYETLIFTLDVPVKQIEVEVMVVDISDGISEEFSVKWKALRDESSRNTTSAGSALVAGITSGSAGLALARGAFDSFMMDVRLQESRGHAQVVTRPRVITRDGVEALFSTTDSFQLRLLGKDAVDSREVSTGMVLKVRPRVIATTPVEAVELSLYFQDGEFSSSAVEGVPIQRKTQLTTLANVQDHHTLVVGGHLFERSDRGVERTPYLSRLPVLGNLFRGTTGSTVRRERLIFITPRILRLSDPVQTKSTLELLERIAR